MRLTLTRDPRRGTLRITAKRAADYPPGHLPRALAAAVQRAVHQLDNPPTADQVPAPRAAADDTPGPVPPDPREPEPEPDRDGRDEAVIRRRVLRMLDRGATERQVADRFGVDLAQVACWDDDAARDAHTDLIADGDGWHPGLVAS